MQPVLTRLLEGKQLGFIEASSFFTALFQEQIPDAKAKAVLLLLARRGESSDELRACVEALRKLEPELKAPCPDLIDTCGTGGDGSHSVNVSTLAAFVIAGAGGHVAKHGNRAISSKSGSSDFLEALGVKIDAPASQMKASLKKNGIGYFHAPLYHPVFARVQPLRKSLGVRTIFNLLGPLVNPFRVAYQLTGVSRPEHLELYAEVFRRRPELKRALICRSEEGWDEISVLRPTKYYLVEKGRVKAGVIDPRKLGVAGGRLQDLKGGSPARNAFLAKKILNGTQRGPLRNLIVINAAAGLWTAGLAKNLNHGVLLAGSAIDSGRALGALQGLVQVSRTGV